ncbi:MAG: hypothetical protein VKJ46_08765 [Leptolyngbyaceae bacterium]|nr:hypothetical protein [Leptolyngbyaceae bacterium]
MSPATLLSTNGNAGMAQSQSWLQLSVKEFFTTVNWEDQLPEVQEIKLQALQGTDEFLKLTLSVSQFFGAVPWEGIMVAAPVPTSLPPLEEVPESDSFTLDAFSDLF